MDAYTAAFMPQEFRQQLERQRASAAERALAGSIVDWTGNEKADPLNIVAVGGASYGAWMARYELFPEVRTPTEQEWRAFYCKGGKQPTDHYVGDPTGRWTFIRRSVPRATTLRTYRGIHTCPGVTFDTPVAIPQLWESSERWRGEPWMSVTPHEVITLRPGTRKAKGHVVVAGMGLGMQLIDVCARRQVRRVTLIERDQALVDWLWPCIQAKCAQPVDVIVGDVFAVLPKLRADVALVDTFPHYGGNDWERDQLRRSCPNVGHVWGWGAYAAYR